jgi:hypothetical protein
VVASVVVTASVVIFSATSVLSEVTLMTKNAANPKITIANKIANERANASPNIFNMVFLSIFLPPENQLFKPNSTLPAKFQILRVKD